MACGVPMVALNLGGTPEKQELREKGFRWVSVFSYDTMASRVFQDLTDAVGR